MNCRDCVERLDQYVDRELNAAEFHELDRHLSECPPCEHQFRLQSGVKRLVKVCCDEGEAPPELRDKLRQILF